jgi:hypothetical protein
MPSQLEASNYLQTTDAGLGATHQSHPTTLADLASLDGAVLDPEAGQLILVGQPGSSSLNLDDFMVALRVIYGGDFPAVSIDPNPNDNSTMNVSYFGGIEGTHLGFVLYEADRLLKVYSMGVDNQTKQSINSNIPGYQSELALAAASVRNIGEPVWHRMWFEPAQLTNDIPVPAGGRRSISLSSLGVTLKTEYVSIDGSPIPGEGSDPAAEAFVAHFNNNFAAFATEQAVLQELVQVRRWLYLVRWLRDANIPVEASWLSQAIATVETPKSTPRTSVIRDLGPYQLMIGGGVDFSLENAYPDPDAFTTTLEDALLAIPPSARAGTFKIDGQDHISVVLPLYKKASYSITTPDGRRLHLSTDDNLILSVEDPQGGVTNFDKYDNNKRLRQKTINTADQVVEYQPLGDGKARTTYPTDEIARLDLVSHLRVQTGQIPAQGATIQELTYALLKSKGLLYAPDWQILPTPTNGELQVWPFTVNGEMRMAVWGESEGFQIPESDLVFEDNVGPSIVRAVRGSTAVDFFSRFLVAQASRDGTQFIYPFTLDDKLYFQVGQTPVSMPDFTEEAFYALLAEEGPNEEILDILRNALAPLLNFRDQTLVFFRGAGFSSTPEGLELENANRQRSDLLTKAFIRLGVFNVHGDDEPQEAIDNLDNQTPLADQTGKWDIRIIIEAASLSGEENTNEIRLIIQTAENAGIPVQTELATPTTEKNLILITGREDEQVENSLLPQLGADNGLQSRYLILFVVDQGQRERSYTRTAIIDYDAAGVLVNEASVKLADVRHSIEALVAQKDGILGLPPAQAVLQAIQLQLTQLDLDDARKAGLQIMLIGLLPRVSQSSKRVFEKSA